MKFSSFNINLFLALKLPSAWLCGVRLIQCNSEKCSTRIKHRWINQNPFGSMYFAAQAMAAELSTGALVLSQIQAQNRHFSMLVAQNKAVFLKKAKGKIMFTCLDGGKVQPALEAAVSTEEGQTFWMKSVGVNSAAEVVAEFYFEWTVKQKQAPKA